MARSRKLQELEFELALTGVLEDIYDLRVRSERDLLDRRTRGYVVLEFRYEYGSGEEDVKVVVSIQGVPDASFPLRADFSDSASIIQSAERCEDLAWAVQLHLDGLQSQEAQSGRRWDD